MRIDDYVDPAEDHLQQLLEMLAHEGMEELRHSCAGLSADEVRDWGRKYETQLGQLAIFPARERSVLLAEFPDARERHLLLIMAAYRTQCGVRWLRLASDHAVDPSIDIHPLTMMSRAAEAYSQIAADEIAIWPFDDGTDPLNEGLLDDDE